MFPSTKPLGSHFWVLRNDSTCLFRQFYLLNTTIICVSSLPSPPWPRPFHSSSHLKYPLCLFIGISASLLSQFKFNSSRHLFRNCALLHENINPSLSCLSCPTSSPPPTYKPSGSSCCCCSFKAPSCLCLLAFTYALPSVSVLHWANSVNPVSLSSSVFFFRKHPWCPY